MFHSIPKSDGDSRDKNNLSILHKPLTGLERNNLDKIFSVQKTRAVNNDFTVKLEGKGSISRETAMSCSKKKQDGY